MDWFLYDIDLRRERVKLSSKFFIVASYLLGMIDFAKLFSMSFEVLRFYFPVSA